MANSANAVIFFSTPLNIDGMNTMNNTPDRISSATGVTTSAVSDSEKFHEMSVATASPPQQCFLLDDDGEFPPMI